MKHNHYHLSRPQFSHVVKRSSEFSSFYSDSLPINKLYLNLLSVYHHRYPLLSLSLSLLFRRFPARFPLFPVKPSLFFLSEKRKDRDNKRIQKVRQQLGLLVCNVGLLVRCNAGF
ncbi:unnamed protein product, partial [Vitis vinifera]